MKRRSRTEILINGSPELIKKLAEEIESHYTIQTIEEPNHGLVMIKVRETAKKSLFYLGEVFITEAKVEIKDEIGVGMIKGNEPERAYYLAVIDAAYRSGLEETKKWEAILIEEDRQIKERFSKKQAKLLETKVSFETMDGE